MSLLFDARAALTGQPGMHALVVGVSAYPHLAGGADPVADPWGMGQLTSTASSAHMIFEWLKAAQLSVPLATCRLLLSPSPGEAALSGVAEPATVDNLLREADAWRRDASTNRDNATLFYFAGHGIQRTKEDAVLCLQDFRRTPGPGAAACGRSGHDPRRHVTGACQERHRQNPVLLRRRLSRAARRAVEVRTHGDEHRIRQGSRRPGRPRSADLLLVDFEPYGPGASGRADPFQQRAARLPSRRRRRFAGRRCGRQPALGGLGRRAQPSPRNADRRPEPAVRRGSDLYDRRPVRRRDDLPAAIGADGRRVAFDRARGGLRGRTTGRPGGRQRRHGHQTGAACPTSGPGATPRGSVQRGLVVQPAGSAVCRSRAVPDGPRSTCGLESEGRVWHW